MLTSQVALKEWACVVEALGSGQQLLLLRKGGIADPGVGFELEHREFLLYPTWEHQAAEAIRPEIWERFRRSPQAKPEPGRVSFQVYGGVAYHAQVKAPEALASLDKHHIWTPAFFRSRLSYKPEVPTLALVVRAYLLKRPVAHSVQPEEAGCKSWVKLKDSVPLEGAEPVLDNRRFRAALEEITACL